MPKFGVYAQAYLLLRLRAPTVLPLSGRKKDKMGSPGTGCRKGKGESARRTGKILPVDRPSAPLNNRTKQLA